METHVLGCGNVLAFMLWNHLVGRFAKQLAPRYPTCNYQVGIKNVAKCVSIHVTEPFSWTFCEIVSTKIRWELNRNVATDFTRNVNLTKIRRTFDGIPTESQRNPDGIPPDSQWNPDGIPMESRWNFHGMS